MTGLERLLEVVEATISVEGEQATIKLTTLKQAIEKYRAEEDDESWLRNDPE